MGVYTIEVYATLKNTQVDYSWFTLIVKSACETALWTNPTITSVLYIINDPIITKTFSPASLSVADCPIGYTLKMKPTPASPFTSTLLSPFLYNSDLNQLTIYTNDVLTIGSYEF
jgi:hypothetical protein